MLKRILATIGILSTLIFLIQSVNLQVYAFNEDRIFEDGSGYGYDLTFRNDINNIKQYNGDRNNYLIVELGQEGMLDKLSNFADKLFSNDDRNNDGYYYKDLTYGNYYYNDNDNSDTLTVYIVAEKNFMYIPDIRVEVDGKEKIVEESDFNGVSATVKFYNVDLDSQVCIESSNFDKCKYPEGSKVRFYLQ